MNGLDFFFSPSPTVDASTTGNNGEDDDWGDFVDSSDVDRNGADPSSPNRIESEKKNQAHWVTSRGPVPLSVFGEEEEGDESGAPVPSFGFSFDSFSSKHNNGNGSVNIVKDSNTDHSVGISGLIANLYRENGHSDLDLLEKKPGNDSYRSSGGLDVDLSNSNRKVENSAGSLETMNWNPLNFGTERSERTSNAVNSSAAEVTLDQNHSDLDKNEDDVDGWDFQSADGGYKDTKDLSSGVWSSPTTNGTGASFDIGKVDAVKSVSEGVNGVDDPWGNGGWEFKVADVEQPKHDLTNKESNGWGLGFGFEPVSKIETSTSFQSNVEKEPQKTENGSISFPNNGDEDFGGTSWAFQQPSLETGKEKEEKEVQINKPKGVLPLSFFEDEKLETPDTLVHQDNFVLSSDFSVREKKAPSPTVSISDLISSLYSQVEEKNAVNHSEKSASDSNVVNGEDDSWEFQVPKTPITEGADDFDSTWEFQGPSPAMENSDVTEGVDDDDSWEFQGPAEPVKDAMPRIGDNGSWEYKHSYVENEVGSQSSVPNGFGELDKKSVCQIDRKNYQDLFYKLKIELYYIALNHLEKLKEARDSAVDSDEVLEVQKRDSEIEDLQNWLNNDVLISEVNRESLQPRSSGISELLKALQEPKFQPLDSEDLLTERLLSRGTGNQR
ncbi:dentin sialophosphoprotein isoform X2 [Capsella rubella]|uniref:dentin sialophosphoprotein isoform X2 n=1 Tax=Capsella rubella TaxID=81985 RepID=UPI000CD52E21|nr:dentin sialophosphoprotein isoform X2 [Capsella rubella]